MTDYLKILRLDYLDYSQRRIADSTRCSRHTIRKVLEVASKANIHWPPLTRTLPTPSWSEFFSRTSTRKSALTLSPIIRTSTVSLQSPALR